MDKIKGIFSNIRHRISRGREDELPEEEMLEPEYDDDVQTGKYRRSSGRGSQTAAPDTGETRLFDATQLKQQQKQKEPQEGDNLFVEKEQRRPFVLSALFTTIRFLLLGVVLGGFALLGAGLGVAKAYVDTTPTLDRAQLTKSDRSSFIYDKDGNLITTIAMVEYRDWVDIEDIPEMLQNAFVAVEDVRFYKHNGVDYKRLFSAMLEVLGNSNASGGSTITQQLIKNKILGTERTYRRKIQEAYLALELEKEIDKKEILEAYLNDIHLGEANYGVKTTAKDFFGKELKDLTIRECAMMAGLTQNPYYYNPRLNKYKRDASRWEATNKRTDKVLGNMYEAGFIDLKEYQAALKEEVYILPESEQRKMYDMPYFVEYAIRDVVTHLLTQRGLTEADRKDVENELRTSGYHIYTTVDRDMQNLVQETLSTWDQYPALLKPAEGEEVEYLSNGEVLRTIQPQASAVVVDYHTGELRAIVGGRDEPLVRKGLNRAYQAYMEVGSSIKPLAVYGPAFDRGASPATIVGNFKSPIEGWNTETGYPYIGSDSYIGPLSIRQGIVSSLNVMAARTLMEWVTPEVGAQYLYDMGVYPDPDKIKVDGSGLALGTSGLTTIQMAAAFGTIANQGEYLEPLSFTRVVDAASNVILDAADVRQSRQVYKPSSAYMLVDVLQNAVQSGTGKKARIDGMTVAGKTGTNSDYRSVYFAGMTPYYSASVWIGHDKPGKSHLRNRSTGGDYAAPLWQAFMEQIHEGLPDKNIIDASPSALGLVKKQVCSVSGLLATEACERDSDGHLPITDWFLDENAPTESCNMHAAVAICSGSGMIATSQCPTTSVVDGSVVLIAPGSYYDQFSDEALQEGMRHYVRTEVPLEQYVEGMAGYGQRCTQHGGGYAPGGSAGSGAVIGGVPDLIEGREYTLVDLKKIARDLREEMQEYLRTTRLSSRYSEVLEGHVLRLGDVFGMLNPDSVRRVIEEAQQDYRVVREAMRPVVLPEDSGGDGNGE